MKTKVENTRYPRLTRAILRRLNREELEDVARNSADAGWSGFTYTADCVAFYKAHKGDILALAQQNADELGEDMLTMVGNFGCLRDEKMSATEVGEALFSGRSDSTTRVRNAMAWFALEEVARELNPDL